MPRTILDESQIHPAMRERVARTTSTIVHKVQAARASMRCWWSAWRRTRIRARRARRSTPPACLPLPRVRQLLRRMAAAQRAEDVDRLADLSDGLRQGHAGRRRRRPGRLIDSGELQAHARPEPRRAAARCGGCGRRCAPRALRGAGAALCSALAGPARQAAAGAPAAPAGCTAWSTGAVRHAAAPARSGAAAAARSIEIHYVVVPAMARRKLPDPVFFLAGGPGQSAIDAGRPVSRMLARFGQPARHRLRRPARHRPLGAAGLRRRRRSRSRWPSRPTRAPAGARCARCLKQLQALPQGDLGFFTTTLAMQDLDAVRARSAPSASTWSARPTARAPRSSTCASFRSGAARVLDGVAPPDMGCRRASRPTARRRSTRCCGLRRRAGVRRRATRSCAPAWRRCWPSLPRPVSVAHPLTGRDESFMLTRDMLLGAGARRALCAGARRGAAGGDRRGGARALRGAGRAGSAHRRRAAARAGAGHALLGRLRRGRAAAARPPPTAGRGVRRRAWRALYREVCAGWPRGEVPAAFYALPPAPAPTLLLSGGIDPATPPRHGERVAQALGPMARHVVVPNAGHGVLAIGCMRDVVFRFVDAADDAEALARRRRLRARRAAAAGVRAAAAAEARR